MKKRWVSLVGKAEGSRQVTRDTMNGPSAIAGLEVH